MTSYNDLFRLRTKHFALKVIAYCSGLPQTTASFVLSKQLLRSATSVAANYRAMCRARSDRERFAKLCIVVEEADETLFWLELLKESAIADHEKTSGLINESEELVKIFNAYKTRLRQS